MRNEIESLPSSSSVVAYQIELLSRVSKCFSPLNFEKARDAETDEELSEIWATNQIGDNSEKEGEIYGNYRRWEARHAFTSNGFHPIPWAAAKGDKYAKISIDMKGIFGCKFYNILG